MTRYDPTPESIRQHQAPAWFHDAKLGIFIHWGLYSVPGWAPTTGPLHDVIASVGWRGWFERNPYAEWYMNSLGIAGSATAEYHHEHFGEGFAYEQFAAQFNQNLADWNADAWAGLFERAGARYVVLTTKHHDGFLLWPSRTPNPFRQNYGSERDLVGELTEAVRARAMRMGLYYSGGLDWTFNDQVIADIADLFRCVPQSPEYVAYANAHIRELIERYAPSTLWNDIAYPAAANLPELFADYYNAIPEGAINDRFTQGRLPAGPVNPEQLLAEAVAHGPPAPPHFDFRTPEYAVFDEIKQEKWESCRGLGYSFGYNRNETVGNMLSSAELIHSFVDIVSKNGNLLINVGPTGDGSIPAEQQERLIALGDWLQVNGEAIYGTRPWRRAEGRTTDGIPVRFTQKGDALFATLLATPTATRVTLEDLAAPDGASIRLLGHDAPLAWEREGGNLAITLPDGVGEAAAHTIRIAI